MHRFSRVSDSVLLDFETSQHENAHNIVNLFTDRFVASRAIYQENSYSAVYATALRRREWVMV